MPRDGMALRSKPTVRLDHSRLLLRRWPAAVSGAAARDEGPAVRGTQV